LPSTNYQKIENTSDRYYVDDEYIQFDGFLPKYKRYYRVKSVPLEGNASDYSKEVCFYCGLGEQDPW